MSLAWWQCTALVVDGDGMVVPDTQLCGAQWWNDGTRHYYVYQILWFIFNDMPRVVQWLRQASTLHQEWVDNWKEHFGIRCCQELVEEGSTRKEWGALKVLQKMISKDYCLARRDTMRESSSSNSWWQPQWLTEWQLKDCSRKGIWYARVDFWNWTFSSWFRAGRQQICE